MHFIHRYRPNGQTMLYPCALLSSILFYKSRFNKIFKLHCVKSISSSQNPLEEPIFFLSFFLLGLQKLFRYTDKPINLLVAHMFNLHPTGLSLTQSNSKFLWPNLIFFWQLGSSGIITHFATINLSIKIINLAAIGNIKWSILVYYSLSTSFKMSSFTIPSSI